MYLPFYFVPNNIVGSVLLKHRPLKLSSQFFAWFMEWRVCTQKPQIGGSCCYSLGCKSCIWWIPTFSPLLCWEFRSLFIVCGFHGRLGNLDRGILPFISFRHSLNPADHKVSSSYLLLWAIMEIDMSFRIRSLYLCIGNWKQKRKMKKTL